MQYTLPQFIDVEDKIIGPLTLKQFLTVMGGGLLILFFWSILGFGILFFMFSLPTAGVFLLLAFGKYNGRPIFSSMLEYAKFYTKPRFRIFIRIAELPVVREKVVEQVKPPVKKPSLLEGEQRSRLKRLAYLLDQKSAEEQRMVHSGKNRQRFMNEI